MILFILFDFVNINNKTINQTPPPLSNIGPHRKFIDEKTCLGCHQNGIDIPGVGIAKKIPHEYRSFCISCHILPTEN